jgi:hypothetical protein
MTRTLTISIWTVFQHNSKWNAYIERNIHSKRHCLPIIWSSTTLITLEDRAMQQQRQTIPPFSLGLGKSFLNHREVDKCSFEQTRWNLWSDKSRHPKIQIRSIGERAPFERWHRERRIAGSWSMWDRSVHNFDLFIISTNNCKDIDMASQPDGMCSYVEKNESWQNSVHPFIRPQTSVLALFGPLTTISNLLMKSGFNSDVCSRRWLKFSYLEKSNVDTQQNCQIATVSNDSSNGLGKVAAIWNGSEQQYETVAIWQFCCVSTLEFRDERTAASAWNKHPNWIHYSLAINANIGYC